MEFTAMIDGGLGGTTKFSEENMADAIERGEKWAKDGDWREAGNVMVTLEGGGEKREFSVRVEQTDFSGHGVL